MPPVPKHPRIIDRALIASLKIEVGECEYCHASPYRHPLDTHHIKTRGAGGDDVRENLIVLCRSCHDRAQRRTIPTRQLIAIVQRREGADARLCRRSVHAG